MLSSLVFHVRKAVKVALRPCRFYTVQPSTVLRKALQQSPGSNASIITYLNARLRYSIEM